MLTMAKSKAGRKPVPGERYPSGQRARNHNETAPATFRRLADQAKAGAADPQWGDPLGAMYLQGEITSAEYAAGREYASRKLSYDQSINAPPGSARSPNFEVGSGRSPDAETHDGQKEARKRAEKARRRHLEGREAISGLPGGLGVLDVLERVCVYQHQPSWAEKLWILPGLRALAVVYRFQRH